MYSKRKIIHIDMDAFFASIEQKDNPSLKGKPLIVGGSPQSRGVVAACSYEARRFGIHSAMPCARAARLCPHAIFTRPRMARYKEISLRIMEIFRQYTPLVEPLSLDEAFLDVTTNSCNNPSATILADTICRQIFRELQLTASAGVSFNKFLAKVASDVNKPNGITTIPPEKALDFLACLPIRKFYGVGKATEQKMHRLGITTGYQLRQWQEDQLVLHFGKIGSFFHDIVRGIDNRPVEPQRIRKSIGCETTLSTDTDDIGKINQILTELAEELGNTLTGKRIGGYGLTLKVRYLDFITITRSSTVKSPLHTADDILPLLPALLHSTAAGSRKIRLLGLSVTKLVDGKSTPRQLKLPFMMGITSRPVVECE
jgi:DNA polymerase-4